MAKKNREEIPTAGDRIAYSWLPAGMEPDSVLAGAGWKIGERWDTREDPKIADTHYARFERA